MNAQISFNFSEMKEYIKLGKNQFSASICSSFLDILSLDIDFIRKEFINKTDFNNFDEIKKTYKKVHKLQPLLFIDEFDLIKHINDFSNPKETLKSYDDSIKQLSSLIDFQKSLDPDSSLLSEFTKNLKYLKQKKKNYQKISQDLPKYINNIFSIIINQIDLYKQIIDLCYFKSENNLFDGFSELSPLKKYVYYSTFEIRNGNIFKNLPSNNIVFSFELLSNGLTEDLKQMLEKNPKQVFKNIFEKNISPIYEYNCQNLSQFLQISFFTCLIENFNIKKCENCHKYFIAYQRSDEKYCNRISPQNKNKTCKQYSNFENWKKNINTNEELKMYRRIYMAKQMKTRRNPEDNILKENFENWKKNAQKFRNEYIHGKIEKDEFINWLNNNS